MKSAHAVLGEIVANEAAKLQRRSTSGTAPLEGSELEVLEVLARCAKHLGAQGGGDDEPDRGAESAAELLALAAR